MARRELKFAEAARVSRIAKRRVIYSYKSVQDSHDAYRGNIDRARSLLGIPGLSFMLGRALGTAEGKTEYTPVLTAHYFQRIIDGLFQDQLEHLQRETGDLEAFGSVDVPTIYEALEDILMSVVVQVWAAFEVLLKQLLDKSLAEHPQCFGHLTGAEPRGFMKRELFRKTYEAFFHNDTRIQNLLNDESVDALCVLRNLIAHSSGFVDDPFTKESALINCTAWASLPIGQRFEFDGKIIWNLVDRNVQNAYRLQDAVHDWLTAHAPAP